jgi:hypothetical protein
MQQRPISQRPHSHLTRLLRGHFFAVVQVATFACAGIPLEARAEQACPSAPDSQGVDASFYQPRECQLLNEHPEIARRAGGRLQIVTKSGASVIFDDNQSGCFSGQGTCEGFRLYELHLEKDIVVIIKGGYEQVWGVLVDRQLGSKILVDDDPYKSPDGSYWAVVKEPGLGSWANIQVVERIDGKLTLVADHLERQAGLEHECTFQEWRSKDSFAVVCPKSGSTGEWSLPEILVRRLAPGKWVPAATGRVLSDDEYERLLQP